MGLTRRSTGKRAIDRSFTATDDPMLNVALAGNPNVGKSTVFNALTGMKQHTGNWSGKTVANARGYCENGTRHYMLVDIPGTYSLMAHSAEEEIARNYICFSHPDAVVVVCDATCLERNLNLVLQIIETGARVIVCVNLMDEAKRKHITLDLAELQRRLGVPVVSTVARSKKTLSRLLDAIDTQLNAPASTPYTVRYAAPIEQAIDALTPLLADKVGTALNARWLALRLLERDIPLQQEIAAFLGFDPTEDPAIITALARQRACLAQEGMTGGALRDSMVRSLVSSAQALCEGVVRRKNAVGDNIDRRIDRVLTGRLFGYPLMLLLLLFVFWLTIEGANLPSQWLADGLFWIQDRLSELFHLLHAPTWLHDALVLGVYRVLAWVVSVMLPPMAIFFPLFTLLEDVGYLPRIAYNLDRPFSRCNACGKQALTMCMGFGCNAAGVVGCRIIDSPRERLLAVLTNSLVPCNGRFPTIISLLTIFFVGSIGGSSITAALLLTAVILLGVLATFGCTWLLSKTILRGTPTAFTLELPPYRRPQIGRVLVHSMLDRSLFVLGRAVSVAAPAGLLIWLMANVSVGGTTLLAHGSALLDPFARLMGLDGVILMAFILGFPANEIVMPIALMAYLAQGSLIDVTDIHQMQAIFVENGWTPLTAVCTMLFSLFHWPCSTTLITIKKETGSVKWMMLAALIPTLLGVLACMVLTALVRMLT